MRTLAYFSLLLVVLLVSLSAYLRLAHSGIGCADWPACYGRIGNVPVASTSVTVEDAYGMLVDESGRAMAWATPLHRLVASVLGLAVFFLFALAIARKRHRIISTALLGLTVWLAALGLRSGGLHDPAIVMGNLAGGFAMLAVLGWLVFSHAPRAQPSPKLAVLTGVAIALLAGQIALGGLTSANFAALACQTLPDCQGEWWPGPDLATAMNLERELSVNADGQALGGAERVAIHKAHRLGGAIVLLAALLTAGLAFAQNARFRPVAVVILALAAAETALGAATVLAGIPIALAVSHNWLAALLLLALLKLLALSLPSRSGPGSAGAEAVHGAHT